MKKKAVIKRPAVTDSRWCDSTQRNQSKLAREHDFCDGKRQAARMVKREQKTNCKMGVLCLSKGRVCAI